MSPHHTQSSPSPCAQGMLRHAPVPSELPQDTDSCSASNGTSLHGTLIHQSISPFQGCERRFLCFSGEDKQPQFRTQNQINYFSRLSTIKPSPTSPTAAATLGAAEEEELGFEPRKKGHAKMVCGRERLAGGVSMQV